MLQVNTALESKLACNIIMPIHNRTSFLSQAFSSLGKQTYDSWRLIVVDDGSNDEPLPLIKKLAQDFFQPIYYIKQKNKGPGAARQAGIDICPEGEYFAFFDSDDEWLPNYLEDAVRRLSEHLDVDWLYVACRRVQHENGKTIQKSTFWRDENTSVPFFNLKSKAYSDVHCFIDNNAVIAEQIKEPINAGFQNSVLRSHIFKELRIPNFRIGEDRHLVVCALAKGFKLAYLDKVNVIYHVHDSNLSDTNDSDINYQKKLFVQNELLASYRDIITNNILSEKLKKLLKKEYANILFWHIGYHIYAPQKQHREAILSMVTAVRYNPGNLKYYKTIADYLAKLLLKL